MPEEKRRRSQVQIASIGMRSPPEGPGGRRSTLSGRAYHERNAGGGEEILHGGELACGALASPGVERVTWRRRT